MKIILILKGLLLWLMLVVNYQMIVEGGLNKRLPSPKPKIKTDSEPIDQKKKDLDDIQTVYCQPLSKTRET